MENNNKQILTVVEKALQERAINHLIVDLDKGTLCMLELKKFIINGTSRIEGLEQMVKKESDRENYEQANFYKMIKSEISNTNYRLKRILQGLPAFEETINETSTG